MSWLGDLLEWLRHRPPPPPPPAPGSSDLLAAHNAERSRRGVPPLQAHPALTTSAQAFAVRLAVAGRLDHFLDGTPSSRARAAGYPSQSVSENLAAGQRSVSEAMSSWMSDPPHAANVLNWQWHSAGFGTATGRDGVVYWVADFGSV